MAIQKRSPVSFGGDTEQIEKTGGGPDSIHKCLIFESDSQEKSPKNGRYAEFDARQVVKVLKDALPDKIQLFRDTFKGREDIVPKYWKSKNKQGYSPICSNQWNPTLCNLKKKSGSCHNCPNADYVPLSDDLLKAHFYGGHSPAHILGVYPLLPDGTCHFIAADFDRHSQDDPDPLEDVKKYVAACDVQELPCYVLRSKSGNGYHVYLFFNAAVPAWKSRTVAFALLIEAGVIGEDVKLSSFDRLFPNQSRLTGKNYGNLISLPFQWKAAIKGHTLFLDPGTGFRLPYADQCETLRSIEKISEADLDTLINDWNLTKESTSILSKNSPPGEPFDVDKIFAGLPEGSRDESLFKYACSLRAQNRPYPEAQVLVLAAAGKCTPPFPEAEAIKKLGQAWAYAPGCKLLKKPLLAAESVPPEKTFDELLDKAMALKPDDLDAIEALVRQTATLSPAKRDHILKAIKKATGANLGPMREILAQGEKGDSQDHLDLARTVIDKIGSKNILGAGPFFYRWDSGAWRQIEGLTICQIIQHTICDNIDITKSNVDSVAAVLQREVFRPDHEFNVGNPEVVNCLNGELHLEDGTWTLKPHNRENYRTSQIPVEYNPEAKAPRFERFLSEVFKGDSDAWEKIKAVLEMFGYTLMAHCRHERFILLIGSGGNGKSVLMDILQWLTGRKNVVGVQPDQLDNTFKRAHLNGKLLNLVTEIKQGEVIADAALKAIVSGETCTVEHKFKPPFEMKPFATCWFGTNHMPHTRDFSDALFRRALIIQFNRNFEKLGLADPKLKMRETWIDEMPGVLNLALEYYAEALTAGFTMPESSEKARQEWRLEADQVADFVEDVCVIDHAAKVQASRLFERYRQWTIDNGIRLTLSMKGFRDRLTRLGFGNHRDMTARYVTGLGF